MNNDRLRSDLAGLADEVTPVDLRERALRTSRRLGIQRAIATSAAAVVMLGAATGTAFALVQRNEGKAPMPADTPSITITPTEPSPTPEISRASELPGAVTSSAPAQPTATIGRLFYGAAPGNADRKTEPLWSFTPGSGPDRLLDLPRNAMMANAMVSPDGTRVAWVDLDLYLRVANVDGSKERKIAPAGHELMETDCWTPTWSPDSRRLLVSPILQAEPTVKTGKGVVDLASGKYSAIKNVQGCHPLWSADGRVLAYADGEGRVALSRPDGTGERFIPNLDPGTDSSSYDIASLSPDGSRIALKVRKAGEPAGDVARELEANAVLDTRTGRKMDLPLGGRTLLQAYFQADGTLVARVSSGDHNALVLIDKDGGKISETPEPASLTDMQILQIAD